MQSVFTFYKQYFFIGLVPLLLCMCAWIIAVRMPVQHQIEAQGVSTTATIEAVRDDDRWFRRRRRGGRSEIIDYHFTTATGVVEKDTLRRSKNYKYPAQVGRRFRLTYLPSSPDKHVSDLRPTYASWTSVWGLLILTGICAVVGLYQNRNLFLR
ncbi:MAG: DUF3592 domain-containing protein [Pseudomonadota bacterium]